MDDMWDLMDENSERKDTRQQNSSEETAPNKKPSLPSNVEAQLKDALQRGMMEQQVAQEAQKDPDEVDMALRL